jgi:hypothetical protein
LGLKIIFHKSELVYFIKEKELEEEYRVLFGCELGSLPFRYLGIPIYFRKIKEWGMEVNRRPF